MWLKLEERSLDSQSCTEQHKVKACDNCFAEDEILYKFD